MLEIARDKKNIEKKEREMKNKEKVKQQQKTIFYFYFFILKNVAFCWKIYSEKVVNSFNLISLPLYYRFFALQGI